jgi:hypothetical protein
LELRALLHILLLLVVELPPGLENEVLKLLKYNAKGFKVC